MRESFFEKLLFFLNFYMKQSKNILERTVSVLKARVLDYFVNCNTIARSDYLRDVRKKFVCL